MSQAGPTLVLWRQSLSKSHIAVGTVTTMAALPHAALPHIAYTPSTQRLWPAHWVVARSSFANLDRTMNCAYRQALGLAAFPPS